MGMGFLGWCKRKAIQTGMPPAAAMVTMLLAFVARYINMSQALARISGLLRCMLITPTMTYSDRGKNKLRVKSRLRVIKRD